MTDSDKDKDPALVHRLYQWNGLYSHGLDCVLTFSVVLRLPLDSYNHAKGLHYTTLRGMIDQLMIVQRRAADHQHGDRFAWRTANAVIAGQLASQLADALFVLTGVRAMVEQCDIGHQPETAETIMAARKAAVP